MNQTLSRWADLSALFLSVLLAVVYTIKTFKSAGGGLRPLALFFLISGPMAIGVHMAAHQIFINYVALQKMRAGSFVYDFRFYALNLMGVTLAVLSFSMLRHCVDYFKGEGNKRKSWLYTCGWIVLVSAPTIPFTVIGSLPVQAVVINLIASLFVRQAKKEIPVLRMVSNAHKPVGSNVLSAVD